MSIVVQLLKNTQAWALALLLTFTATSKAALLFTSDGTAITITGSNPKATGVLIIPTRINNLPVTSIAYEAFAYCNGLTSFSVDIANSTFSSNDGVLFNKAQTSLLSFPNGKAGGYTIPNSVTSIGSWAFWACFEKTDSKIESFG